MRSCQLDFARLCLLGTLDLTEALSASSAFESEADAARVVRMLAHDTVRIMYKASPLWERNQLQAANCSQSSSCSWWCRGEKAEQWLSELQTLQSTASSRPRLHLPTNSPVAQQGIYQPRQMSVVVSVTSTSTSVSEADGNAKVLQNKHNVQWQ